MYNAWDDVPSRRASLASWKRQSYTDQYLSDRLGDVHCHGLISQWVMCCSVLIQSSAWWLLKTMKPSFVTTFLLLYVSTKIQLYSVKQKRMRSVTYFVVLKLKARNFTFKMCHGTYSLVFHAVSTCCPASDIWLQCRASPPVYSCLVFSGARTRNHEKLI